MSHDLLADFLETRRDLFGVMISRACLARTGDDLGDVGMAILVLAVQTERGTHPLELAALEREVLRRIALAAHSEMLRLHFDLGWPDSPTLLELLGLDPEPALPLLVLERLAQLIERRDAATARALASEALLQADRRLLLRIGPPSRATA